MKSRLLLLLGFAVWNLSVTASRCESASAEPSEAEMRQAIQDRIDVINENIARMKNAKPDKNNPMDALLVITGAILGDSRYYIGAFKKIGAAKAEGMPGYMCDYMLQLRVEGKSGAPMDSVLRLGGSLCTARFVRSDGRWIWIPPAQNP